MTRIFALDPHKGKSILCGEIKGGVFVRKVKPEHFMRVVGGYGIQEDAFEEVLVNQVKTIVLIENKGKEWQSKIEDWLLHGKVADYGHGKQRFLSLRYMEGIPIKKEGGEN